MKMPLDILKNNITEDKQTAAEDEVKAIMDDPDFLTFAKMFGANTADWVDDSPSKKAEDFIKQKAIDLGYEEVGDLLNDEKVYEKECTEYIKSLNLTGADREAFEDWVWHIKNYF